MRGRLTSGWLRYNAPVLVCLAAVILLLLLPTGYEGALLYQDAERCSARVVEDRKSVV